MHHALAVLGSAMFGLVAMFVLVDIVGYLAAAVRRRFSSTEHRLPCPGRFNLNHPESNLMRRFRGDRLARWT
jgi:hypothetical protein